ncbi:hypothetical protein Q75_15465 [Bacillus coahuilensis p1.1.43]|uniref:Uncharacterized protein n=2 Tax=Bacillus coahuilensis TaxID=408580 RepID=A0A147K4M0_9BACI|nr:hypothetical protein Q75_15465 [Bacillus coahuilensis p1.1.43]
MSEGKLVSRILLRGRMVYRMETFLQWGDSSESIGSCLMLYPKYSRFSTDSPPLLGEVIMASLSKSSSVKRMEQLVKSMYGNTPLNGRFYIYYLIPFEGDKVEYVLGQFEGFITRGIIQLEDYMPTDEELRKHPWIILSWGIQKQNHTMNLNNSKKEWLDRLNRVETKTLGIKHPDTGDYYNINQKATGYRDSIIHQILQVFQGEVKGESLKEEFTVYATKPSRMLYRVFPSSQPTSIQQETINPEMCVYAYHTLELKMGYTLVAVSHQSGDAGMCKVVAQLNGKREDYMHSLKGDRSSLSFLHAAMVYHHLHEFGAVGEYRVFMNEQVLPFTDDYSSVEEYLQSLHVYPIKEFPSTLYPHFYYEEGHPTIVFYTVSKKKGAPYTLYRYTHRFEKHSYACTYRKESLCYGHNIEIPN